VWSSRDRCLLGNQVLTKRYGKLFLDTLPKGPVEMVWQGGFQLFLRF
jgi:hypothetical protein